ncbi:uncharacterized protein SPSC_00076 [Sporisorium scitamineum]|uniref:Uncharacterized protein n=1 Tax=Sporisorium scitamineum TaxID=49012 RepID=A0A127Z5G0_9BASI|nr:uncharacterized protein SPSC_00076 [Sporisorium scitamineum]
MKILTALTIASVAVKAPLVALYLDNPVFPPRCPCTIAYTRSKSTLIWRKAQEDTERLRNHFYGQGWSRPQVRQRVSVPSPITSEVVMRVRNNLNSRPDVRRFIYLGRTNTEQLGMALAAPVFLDPRARRRTGLDSTGCPKVGDREIPNNGGARERDRAWNCSSSRPHGKSSFHSKPGN